jgi:hypothetical protein
MQGMRVISVNPTARHRRWWAAFALVALAFLSLRPACDVWLSHWDKHTGAHHVTTHQVGAQAISHAPTEPLCCATIEDGGLVKPFDMVAWGADPSKATVAIFSQFVLAPTVPMYSLLTASVRPPGNASFYVRSARILR